jgi:hypothetical protein
MCTFTGGEHNESTAESGPCTGVRGYISDAEIRDIASSPGRVVTSFLDSKSQTDVLYTTATSGLATCLDHQG